MTAATTASRADVIRNIFWQPLRIADHDKANESLDALVAEVEHLREALRAIDTHGKRLLIDQGRGLQAHITEALNEC